MNARVLSDGHTSIQDALDTAEEMHDLAEERAEQCDDEAATLLSKGAAIIEMLATHKTEAEITHSSTGD